MMERNFRTAGSSTLVSDNACRKGLPGSATHDDWQANDGSRFSTFVSLSVLGEEKNK